MTVNYMHFGILCHVIIFIINDITIDSSTKRNKIIK
jgi:hypothetical protein